MGNISHKTLSATLKEMEAESIETMNKYIDILLTVYYCINRVIQ